MSGALKSIGSVITRFNNKKGELKGKAAGKLFGDSAEKAKVKFDKQFYATISSPATSSGNKERDAIRDPLDLFGHNEAHLVKEAEEEEARRIAALPGPRPIPDEQELNRVRRRNAQRARGRRGRASTILSDEAGTTPLGG